MNAVELVRDNCDITKVLNHYNAEKLHIRGNRIRCCCPIHRGDNPTAFCADTRNNLWYCHTGSCGGGDVFDLVMKIEGVSFTESVRKLCEIFNINIDGSSDIVYKDNTGRLKQEVKRFVLDSYSKKDTRINKRYSFPLTADFYKTDERFDRFDLDILRKNNSMFCKKYEIEGGFIYDKLIVPLYDSENELIGVAARTLTNSLPKWYYAPRGLYTGSILYNFNNLDMRCSQIVLVEGIFDVWAYQRIGFNNVLAILGSNLTDRQAKMLLKSGCDFILSFDSDKAGRKATSVAREKLGKYARIEEVELPDGKDPADLPEDELRELLLNVCNADVKKKVVGE